MVHLSICLSSGSGPGPLSSPEGEEVGEVHLQFWTRYSCKSEAKSSLMFVMVTMRRICSLTLVPLLPWRRSRACWEPGELQPGSGQAGRKQLGTGRRLREVLLPRQRARRPAEEPGQSAAGRRPGPTTRPSLPFILLWRR